jgi:MATE family multidrug resistance protein
VAALALADAILEFWTIAIVGLVAALLIVIARRLGQGRDQAVGQTFNTVLLLVVLISLVLTATLKLGSPLLLKYVVVSRNVGSAVDAFLQIAAYGIIFQSISFTYTALYVGLGRTRVLVGAGTVLVLTNFVLSYVLIFGKLGLPPMGIEGAALGELGAEVATFIFLTTYTLRRLDLGRYRLFRLEPWDGKLVWFMLRTSSPLSLQELLEGLEGVYSS